MRLRGSAPGMLALLLVTLLAASLGPHAARGQSGKVQDEGKSLLLSPVESGHALDSLTLTSNGRGVDVGSDGVVPASAVQSMVGKPKDGEKTGSIPVKVEARYVEAGQDRRGGGTYRIRYRWEGGGLFGGKDLRLTGWSRG